MVSINPAQCRMWALHERLEEDINEKTCKAEIQSFQEHGQLIPVLGRRLHQDRTHEVELIYGARRLFVARHLNMPLLVELCSYSDREGIIAMNIENGQRLDISAYERGLGYEHWLRAGCFASQQDLARALTLSRSHVSRMLKVATLPRPIVDAFGGPRALPESWGVHLAQLLEMPGRLEQCLQTAKEIMAITSRPAPHEVYRMLLESMSSQHRRKVSAHDRVVRTEGGASLFSIRSQGDSIAIIVPLRGLPPDTFQDIANAIENTLSS